MRFYEQPSREQASLYGQSLREAVAHEPEVLALDAALDQLDFRALEAQYSETGHPAYHPRVLAGILIYGYSLGMRVSRLLESMCRLHAGFRFLTFGLEPDHNTICRFRAEHLAALRQLFRESVRLCQEAGLVRLGQVAIDGTKVRANRSRKALAAAEAGFAQAMAETVAAEREECALMRTPEGIQPAYNLQAAVDGEQQVVVACGVSAQANEAGQLQPLVAQVAETCGVLPQQVLADGGYHHQEQLAALEAQGIESYVPVRTQGLGSLIWEEAQQAYRCPAGHWLRRHGERKGKVIYRCSRCGKCPRKQGCGVTGCSKEVHVAPGTHGALASVVTRMQSIAGQAIYAARSRIIEPFFAWCKQHRGFRRLLLRGRTKVEGEWYLLCAGHNLRQWWRGGGGRVSRSGRGAGLVQVGGGACHPGELCTAAKRDQRRAGLLSSITHMHGCVRGL